MIPNPPWRVLALLLGAIELTLLLSVDQSIFAIHLGQKVHDEATLKDDISPPARGDSVWKSAPFLIAKKERDIDSKSSVFCKIGAYFFKLDPHKFLKNQWNYNLTSWDKQRYDVKLHGWWFQPSWKIWVKMGMFPKWGWKLKKMKPPPSHEFSHVPILFLSPSFGFLPLSATKKLRKLSSPRSVRSSSKKASKVPLGVAGKPPVEVSVETAVAAMGFGFKKLDDAI